MIIFKNEIFKEKFKFSIQKHTGFESGFMIKFIINNFPTEDEKREGGVLGGFGHFVIWEDFPRVYRHKKFHTKKEAKLSICWKFIIQFLYSAD